MYSNTNEYIRQYNSLLKSVQVERTAITKELSDVDLQVSDLLHALEFEKIDAVGMVRVSKKLKELQMQRRSIKHRVAAVDSVLGSMNKALKEKKETIHNVYKYRTEEIKEFIKEI